MKNWKKWKFKIFWEFEDIFFSKISKFQNLKNFHFFSKISNFQNLKNLKIFENLKISKSQKFEKISKFQNLKIFENFRKKSQNRNLNFFFFFWPTFFFFFSNFENIFGPDFEEKLFWASLNIENVDFWVLAPLKWRFF